MPNVLKKDKQIAIISGLAEGMSMRALSRVTGVHQDTISRLGVRVGQACARLMDEKLRNLTCHYLEFDEIWGFIGKKEKHRRETDDPTLGDVWTFCAIDAETKLVPSFKVGKRDHITANAFVSDVASRLNNRPQVSSDGLRAYIEAVENAFGLGVDFGMIIKSYGVDRGEHHQERRYSAPEVTSMQKIDVMGHPSRDLISTSHIERLNGTTRLHMRRLTRLTYAFSKKIENFEAAVALHFAYYNFVKTHSAVRCTPAMACRCREKFSDRWRFSRGGMSGDYIAELADAIRNLYHTEPVYVETVPVKEVFQGQTVWEGEVEVFDLPESPEADRIYAWAHETDNADEPRRTVTVLHVPPVVSPELAVRASIIQDYREGIDHEQH